MATIVPRKRTNGTIGYQAQISVWRDGRPTFRQTRTFDRKQAAAAWAEGREKELSKPGGVERAKVGDPTLSEIIGQYVETTSTIGRTKAQVLRTIKDHKIGGLRGSQIGSPDLVEFAQSLDVGPSTRANYLSHLASVFTVARPMWGYPLDKKVMTDALTVCSRMKITGKSRARDRRPTLDELDLILTHYGARQRQRPWMAPMQKIVVFALFSTRRQEEITRITWNDFDEAGARVLVRDMKNPGEKIGNDVWCDLPPEALRMIKAMPRTEEQIFPYSTDAISASFTRTAAFLAIDNLVFHDLRHEGVSRLFEMGLSIPRVASVSGHRSWQSLKRYTHMRQTGDKYNDWRWLDIVAPQT
jgi:integrase